VIERATGERFDRVMQRLVMGPLGLDACYNWSGCSDVKIARAVVLYRPDGSVARDDLGGRRPDCMVATEGPGCDLDSYVLGSNGALFSPQGGLRASPRDLAVIGQLLLNRGRHGDRAFLSERSMDVITRPLWLFDGANGDTSNGFYCAYGLASHSIPTGMPGCRDELLVGERKVIGHAGEAYNLRSGLWVDPARRVGIAFYAANNPVEPPPSQTAFSAVEEWLAAKLPR
jgi:CubicO group peptidase (beta-lactamase class C family)